MTVRTERHEHILIVRIEREAKRNAIDRETTLALDAAFNELDDDPALWCGILTGTLKVFSAGTDLAERNHVLPERGGEYGLVRRDRQTPLIAAVEGMALGGGFELALACDLVIAADNASFGLPEVRRGVVASSGALLRLPRVLPSMVARQLLLTGRPMSAGRLAEFGLVNEIVEPGSALTAALGWANEIVTASPTSVRATLRALNAQTAGADALGWQATAEAVQTVMASDDLTEGIAAFFEKRDPRWSGR
jgi:enoyl-CoA hydratase